ncbi:alpha/beta fold hydrolase [Roseibium sp.]|uniref:alpha/beta fold hydrolase n=1 Tax=Roseibium sp. TaxID=1936156 RepID=UPI003D0CBCA2
MSNHKLHIRDEGTGRPLVMIHGWSCPGVFFRGQMEALTPHARCIVPDLPGHGATGDRVPLSIESAADAVHAYLADQGLRDIVLCGWSMGALVAYSLIERHGPERVASVVAVDMSPRVLNGEDWRNGSLNGLTAELNTHVLEGMVADWSRLPGRIAMRLFAEGVATDPELQAFASTEIAKADPSLLKPMWASLTDQDFRPLLKDFPVPLHLAAGLRSQLYGPGVHRWHEQNVPCFHLHGFENSGHAPHLEEPERFNELLAGLLT